MTIKLVQYDVALTWRAILKGEDEPVDKRYAIRLSNLDKHIRIFAK
ncbi:hypothetical protein L7E55_02585 [Pelotomaculum isophthalicicum JI]|uniref:Uncharacterized protein n=1 Tax=Pelotomaculum isophthalicicum JI TaxID=947010 RepID=A0A9X4H0F6_9FIRM|nr:hypothetical protein [Pelotomaculum isophthalicicum]MDF9407251.1 hypothetical protein [Pelotomaculum isophthalicicum JI]